MLCGGAEAQVYLTGSQALVLGQDALALDAVRALEDQGQGQVAQGDGLGIADQGGHMDRLAGAVGAALGDHVDVQGLGCRAALHASVAQVERGLGQVQQAIVPVRALGDQQGRGVAARAEQ